MKAAASMKGKIRTLCQFKNSTVKIGQLQFQKKALETDLSQTTKERDNLKNLYELAKQNVSTLSQPKILTPQRELHKQYKWRWKI